MITGTIKAYKEDKGYGFIQVNGQADAFFHKSDLNFDDSDAIIGSEVLFEQFRSHKGLAAKNICLVDNFLELESGIDESNLVCLNQPKEKLKSFSRIYKVASASKVIEMKSVIADKSKEAFTNSANFIGNAFISVGNKLVKAAN